MWVIWHSRVILSNACRYAADMLVYAADMLVYADDDVGGGWCVWG